MLSIQVYLSGPRYNSTAAAPRYYRAVQRIEALPDAPFWRTAALWESTSQDHPFLDGNKRTAFAAAYTFLAVNGARLTTDSQDMQDFVLALYEKSQFTFDKLAPWLRGHLAFDK